MKIGGRLFRHINLVATVSLKRVNLTNEIGSLGTYTGHGISMISTIIINEG